MRGESAVTDLAIPTENLAKVLASAAVPGFNGEVRIEFGIRPEAVANVCMVVIRRGVQKNGTGPELVAAAGTPERNDLVEKMVATVRRQLRLSTKVFAIVAHFNDGKLMKHEVVNAPDEVGAG